MSIAYFEEFYWKHQLGNAASIAAANQLIALPAVVSAHTHPLSPISRGLPYKVDVSMKLAPITATVPPEGRSV